VVITELTADKANCRVVIRPNRSMSWKQSVLFIWSVAIVLGTVSIAFAVKGYWMIIPFAGLELAALIYCSYLVADSGMLCELVSMDESEVVVEKGRQRRKGSEKGGPSSRISFPRAWARVELKPYGRWYPDKLLIGASGSRVELGEFLGEEEKEKLAVELKRLLQEKTHY
tara:strand:- start:1170 stop:1679 length:510 start_codon:yes stop_codon:yes gene_type:complete